MKKYPIVQIDEYTLTNYGKPFIVAEAGVNHNGEISTALKMVTTAKKVGAHAIKFQTFKAEEFCGSPAQEFTYLSQGNEVTESMLEMFKRYEFSRSEWFQIKQKCDEEDILFMSTAQNRSDLDLLLEIGIPAVKVGSDDFTNLPLLKDYASTGLPMIVSCGMADFSDVYNALNTIGSLDGYPTVLLLCTSEYPTSAENVNLLKLKTLSDAFPQLILGFSDHSQGQLASSLAVALGACCFEKHFTLDNDLPGPDHWFSENPDGLAAWAKSINDSYKILGNPIVRPTDSEISMRTIARRSIVVLQNIEAGERFTPNNLGLRRPGSGLPPVWFHKVLQYSARRKLNAGKVLEVNDIK